MPGARAWFDAFRRSWAGQCVVGAALVGIAAGLLYIFADDVGHRYPFFSFIPAILLAARLGGPIAGSVASVISAVAIYVEWLSHAAAHSIGPSTNALALVLFIAIGIFISLTHGRLSEREAQLRTAVEALDGSAKREAEANRLKDEFLATLSHEIRTPLNVIIGYTRMLREAGDDAARARMIDVLERNAAVQLRLIEDLLDTQRIVQGRLTIERSLFDLHQLGAAVVDSLRPAAQAKRLHWMIHIDPILMEGDSARIQQVLWNLLSNAIKFTPRDGCIGLRAVRRGNSVIIHIQDSGEGIPADFLPHVFERFRQLDAGPTRRHFGMGLGLAIVKHVVELHGGTVTAASAGEGQGAEFVVQLPLGAGVHNRTELASGNANGLDDAPAMPTETPRSAWSIE